MTAVAREVAPCSAKSGPRPENARARRAAAPPWTAFPERLRDPRLVDETCTMAGRYLGVAEG
ncbi:MAG TPA: hypothetical protein VHT91_35650 [Kofleriaceae bacterium]|nr:hypothetical protein [Kofleriaceae bacterium]